MKRLNRKGFTLVELLAVIVILAIVVGIALTTVLPTLKKSRQSAFELTANTAADYFEKQYSLYMIGDSSYTFTTDNLDGPNTMSSSDYQLAGIKEGNYVSGTWEIMGTGRVCVWLVANPDGEYYDAGTTAGHYNQVYSEGCGQRASSNYNIG